MSGLGMNKAGMRLTSYRVAGTCQERLDRCERFDSDFEWKTCDGYVAGYLVPRVQGSEALEESGGYDSGREDVTEWS